MYDKFLLPWDFTSVATVINNYAAIRIKHKWHTDAILNEADFIQVTMCLAYKPACWQLSCISFCVRSKYSTLLGRTAATCVSVIWLYYQNMNIIMYTHFSDSIPMRATAAMSVLPALGKQQTWWGLISHWGLVLFQCSKLFLLRPQLY